MSAVRPLDRASYQALVGREIGISGWLTVGQEMIDGFADLTGDRQFIHVDPERAEATPLGGTVAHGFLSLSLLSRFAYDAVPPLAGAEMSLNYGFDRLRFLSPVRAGAKIRARFTLKDLQQRSSREILLVLDVFVEIDGGSKPALIAEWLSLNIMG
jgi:acyl dehydratase